MNTPILSILETERKLISECDAKPSTGGWQSGRCPNRSAHSNGDKNRSFSFRVEPTGHVGFTCHAGCDSDTIIAALETMGIPKASLFERPANDYSNGNGHKASPPATAKPSHKKYKNLDDYAKQHGATGKIFREWGCKKVTHNNHPAILFPTPGGNHYRYLDSNPEAGVWAFEAGASRSVYGLESAIAIAEKDWIVQTNGEASVIVAQSYGIPAFCRTGGESKLSPEHLTEITDKYAGKVLVAFDCDDTGRKAAPEVAAQYVGAGLAASALNFDMFEAADLADFCNRHGQDSLAEFQKLRALPEPVAETPLPEAPWRILTPEQVIAMPPIEYLIDGEIPQGGLSVLFGPSGSGKSFLALDYALQIAQDAPVVYMAGEGQGGYGDRLLAWSHHNRKDFGQFLLLDTAVPLLDEIKIDILISQLCQLSPALVVVDTLARSMLGGDENSARDMGMMIAACNDLQRATGAAVLLVHHTGKSGFSERGSSALRGAADSMIELTNSDGLITVSCSKSKDGEPFEDKKLRLLPVPTRDTRTSCVLITSKDMRRSGDDKLSQQQKKILETLAMSVLREAGATGRKLVSLTHISSSSLYRSLSTLKEHEFVRQAANGEPYFITEKGQEKLTE